MSKGVLLTVVVVLSASFPSYATTWFDDFESYTVGDFLSDYADWTYGGGAGGFIIADYGGSICIGTDLWPRCYYEPPGELADSRVSFDVLFTGGEARAYAMFRYDPGIHEGYIAGCINNYSLSNDDDVLVFGCAFEHSMAIYWPVVNIFDYFEEGIWYHIDAMIWGSGEDAYYEIVVDGDVGITYPYPVPRGEGIPEYDSGYCGITVYSPYEPFNSYIDNYEVEDEATIGVQPSSLGALKAAFR
jgi:hypothetical protein